MVCWLVEQETVRASYQHLRQRDPHLPASAELAAQLCPFLNREAEPIEDAADAPLDSIAIEGLEPIEETPPLARSDHKRYVLEYIEATERLGDALCKEHGYRAASTFSASSSSSSIRLPVSSMNTVSIVISSTGRPRATRSRSLKGVPSATIRPFAMKAMRSHSSSASSMSCVVSKIVLSCSSLT